MRISGNQQGIGVIGILIIGGAVFLIGLAGWSVFAAMTADSNKNKQTPTTQPGQTDTGLTDAGSDGKVIRWNPDANGNWKPAETPVPTCPVQPMMASPSDMGYLTLVQYPGQPRDGRYKTVGTLHFRGIANDQVEVKAPMDATVLRGARYKVGGEMLYSFDFVNSCGIMYRLGHLKTLTSAMEALANAFPETADDSKMTALPDGIVVMAGERIASAVGVASQSKTFYDFGIYDLRAPNSLSQNADYVNQNGREVAGHGVCWFDWIPTAEAAKVKRAAKNQEQTLKKNDYCPIEPT